jgi:tetratricopeptide (TPR) repeat protein
LEISTNTSLPISFKTVSEFRRERTQLSKNSGASAVHTGQMMPLINELFPTADDTEANSHPVENVSPAISYKQAPSQVSVPPFSLELAIDCSATPQVAQSIEQALEYFDREARDVASSFHCDTAQPISDLNHAIDSSNAIDLNNAFDLNNSIDLNTISLNASDFTAPNSTHQELSAPIHPELMEDDGRVAPMNEADFVGSQEMPLPDEPSLATYRMVDQAAVLKDPQESSSVSVPIEKDDFGRVVKVLFCGVESVRFQYDNNGNLLEFNYAGMQWTREESGWAAQDRQTEYFVEGQITVLETGALRIERDDVVRILKISGTRIDEHKSGSRTESRKLKNKPSPYDLLAKAKAVNSLWLHAKAPSKSESSATPPAVPLKLDLLQNDVPSFSMPEHGSNSMIPEIAKVHGNNPAVLNPSNLTCVPSAPIELRSLERTEKLRSLEDELLDPEFEDGSKSKIRHKSREYWLKCNLWITDRLFGQSSPKHLEKLDRLAQLYFEQQNNDLSELTHLRALHIREQFFGKGQPELAENVRGLARIYETRGNFARAEEMYKEAIQLQEGGLRKVLFLYSERVIGNDKLDERLDLLFACIADLSRLYSMQGKQNLCAVVYEKALALAAEIQEREPNAEQALHGSAASHLKTMEELSISDLLT